MGRCNIGDVPLGGSPFPPIADYAFLSDCEVCALVAPSGNVEWMCLPRFDGPSLFGAMLDRDAGLLQARARRRDRAGRPALPAGHDGARDDVGHATGWMIVRDVLLIGPWHHDDERSHHAPPAADRLRRRPRAAAHAALRQRRGGDAHGVRARPDYGAHGAVAGTTTAPATTRPSRRAEGEDRGAAADDRPAARLRGRPRARRARRCATATSRSSRWPGPSTPAPTTYDEALRAAGRTRADYWHEWLSHGDFPDHPWRDATCSAAR